MRTLSSTSSKHSNNISWPCLLGGRHLLFECLISSFSVLVVFDYVDYLQSEIVPNIVVVTLLRSSTIPASLSRLLHYGFLSIRWLCEIRDLLSHGCWCTVTVFDHSLPAASPFGISFRIVALRTNVFQFRCNDGTLLLVQTVWVIIAC